MPMKNLLFALLLVTLPALAITESVYVLSPTDTDHDGVPDRIYVSIKRPDVEQKLSSLYEISPYSGGTNYGVKFHDVDSPLLPQDEESFWKFFSTAPTKRSLAIPEVIISEDRFITASVKAHSLGTGKSTGCPTIGDENEILAAKAVIDWLNGRARAVDENGKDVKADWANGKVGMTGVSYNGTLPIMVASTGVEGLKAIVPIAAISNWYDYYRANGLVVGPSGYVGEDADVLANFVLTSGKCQKEVQELTEQQGREHGDFSPFWQARNHLARAKNFKAATFIIHGQSDWNVKQKHAIQLWEALDGVVPRRMILHRGGHGQGSVFDTSRKIRDWFAHFLDGEDNGIEKGFLVEVEHLDSSQSVQASWPHPGARKERMYFSSDLTLSARPVTEAVLEFEDQGKEKKLESFIGAPGEEREGRLLFVTAPFESDRILTGTTRVNLRIAVKNRRAANLTVAIVEYNKYGKATVVTRGWADPQNHQNLRRGETLEPGRFYDVAFNLEPKQERFEKGSRLAVLILSTDYNFTLRPDVGTQLQVNLGDKSYLDLMLTK